MATEANSPVAIFYQKTPDTNAHMRYLSGVVQSLCQTFLKIMCQAFLKNHVDKMKEC